MIHAKMSDSGQAFWGSEAWGVFQSGASSLSV